MIYSKNQIEAQSKETGFIKHYIEKVLRLLDVLQFIFSESSFKNKLVLKGGTAINLVYTDLKRLSVDIDLDYIGSLDKEATIEDRKLLEEELDKYMVMQKYEISPSSRSSFALFSRVYRYTNAFNNADTIKVDINFMDRVHIYPCIESKVTYFNKTVAIKTPAFEELFGMKLTALIDRSKPRDLYDSLYLLDNSKAIDEKLLRKSVIFYLSLNNTFDIEDSFNKIKMINNHNVKVELQPVLKKEEHFDLKEAQDRVLEYLKKLLNLTKSEKQYMSEFSKGNYNPSLLFDDPIASKLINHPMAKWRVQNIKEKSK